MRRTGIAAFSDLRTPSSDGVRDAVTTRPSASANFFIDSTDRAGGTSTDFTINKNQSLFNGYFNRLAVAEVVLEWGIPNVAAYWGNNTIVITNPATAYSATVTISDGFYTVVPLLQTIASTFNALAAGAGDPLRLEVLSSPTAEVGLFSTNIAVPFNVSAGTLASQLFTSSLIGVNTPGISAETPFVLGTRYIDIVSSQLTYNQELKDNTTATVTRDVLYRWYLAEDNVPQDYDYIVKQIDAGQVGPPFIAPTYATVPVRVPILQGYTNFVARRTPPVAKQIRWSPEQPIGQVAFQVYDDQGRLLSTSNFVGGAKIEFQMSMLLSED